MPTPRAATTIRKTPNFDFIFGRYSHSDFKIPYFQISMSFGDAAEYLKLVNEMPGAASMDWSVEELFQRDIDWARVDRKIVPYLKQRSHAQFFNSLTIAIVPIRNNTIEGFGAPNPWRAPPLESEEQFAQGAVRHFGPITCGYWNAWTDPTENNARLGQLCWNTQETCGIAIDGQHRLAAIKSLVGSGDEWSRRSSVPVIFVVLDPQLGYTRPPDRRHLISTIRSLFIDLNKHALKVSRARQILLDDRDPVSICVRALVGRKLMAGDAELREDPPTLPLTLVDWHSERALFNDGPYLTTILGTDWAVARVLGIRPFEDPMAFDSIDTLIGRLEKKLNITLDKARTRLEDCRRYEKPFAFEENPEDELESIGKGFVRRWSNPLIHLLTQYRPYQELIGVRRSHESLTPEFSNWFAIKQSADEAKGHGRPAALLQQYQNDLMSRKDPVSPSDLSDAVAACKGVKETSELAFTVVFQRALVLAYLQFVKVSGSMMDALEDEGELDIDAVVSELSDDESEEGVEQQRAEDLVEALNKTLEGQPDFLRLEFEYDVDESPDIFWLCSFRTPEGVIDFTQSASSRAADLLLLVGLFWLYRQADADQTFDDVIGLADRASGGLDLKLQQCLGRMSSGPMSIAMRILKSRDKKETDAAKKSEVLARARCLWDALAP